MCSSRWGTFLNMYCAGNSKSSRLSRSRSCLRRKSYQRRGSPVGTLSMRSIAPMSRISWGVVTAADPTGGSDGSSDCGTRSACRSYDACDPVRRGRGGTALDRRPDEDAVELATVDDVDAHRNESRAGLWKRLAIGGGRGALRAVGVGG